VHEFYHSDPKRGFYGGGGIDGRFAPAPAGWALSSTPPKPSWGAGFKTSLRDFPKSMIAECHTTSLAVESNAVSIDPQLKDAWGVPAMRATYRDHPDDLATAKFLQRHAQQILDAAGAKKSWIMPTVDNTVGVHLLGTCRMGDDPRSSVVDRYHRSHDVPNLFLCDGSSFVTSGRGQPTMTIQALAFRAADHIARFARNNEI
jgi:choline dehydrogenase-like flavoprotein